VLKDSVWRQHPYRVERDGRDLKRYLTERVWVTFEAKPYHLALDELLEALKKNPPKM
jgi:hypothetical protein